jgi:hypothetical protein
MLQRAVELGLAPPETAKDQTDLIPLAARDLMECTGVLRSAKNDPHERLPATALSETLAVPSGENETDVTINVCPSKGSPTGCHAATSHSQTVFSSEPETMQVSFGENDTKLTLEVCPHKGSPIGCRVAAFHSRTVILLEPVAMRDSLGENAIVSMKLTVRELKKVTFLSCRQR